MIQEVLFDVETWKAVGVVIGGLTALIGVFITIHKFTKPKILIARSWISSLNKAIGELNTNGGGSLKDKIVRIDKTTQESAARVAIILTRDTKPIFECAPDGACTFANHAICDLFNLDRAEMMGSGWLEAVVPEDREKIYDAWLSAVKKRIPYEATYTVRSANGKVAVIARAEPMLSTSGVLLGFNGTVQIAPVMAGL